MADSILKLRVESSEYDAKLKKAAEGIRHLADVAHQGGGELTGLEKAELDYVKALGTMETRSRTAAGSVRELESTYKELKVIYDQLNDVEKADEGGKALAASLEQIKQRTQEARAQLDNASKSLNDNGQEAQQSSSALDALASKFTINIDALKLFNIGLQAAKGALDVAKDAFMSSEANVDEWGRVIDSSKSLYEGFLTALNTGDISGYLNNIDSIVQAARTAYNELDRLGTMKTIQAPQMSAQQTENERIRSMIQTGRYIAPIDGRRNAVFNGREMQSGDKLTAGQIRAMEKQLQNGMQKVVTLVGNEVKQTGKAIDAVYNRQAKELGMDLSEFRKGTSSMAEFDKRMSGYDQYQKWRNENYYTDNWGNRRVKEGNPFEEYKKWGTFRVDGERYNDLVRLIQQRDQQAGQAYGMQSQAYRAMNRAEGFTVSKLMKGDTTKSGKSTKTEQTELQQNQTKINALTQEYIKLGDESTDAVRERQAEIQKEIALLQQRNGLLGLRAEQAQGRLTLGTGDFQRDGLSNTPGTLLKAPDTTIPSGGLQLDDKAMKALTKNLEKQQKNDEKNKVSLGKEVSNIAGGVSSVFSGLQQLGIELPEGLQNVLGGVQAITTILTGIATTVLAIEAIAGSDALIPFANGGVVPGFANGGVIDSGHSPSFLSFSKAAPAFATGGTVEAGHAPNFISFSKVAPSFATGGVVPQTFTSLPKFNEGGTVEAGHAPDFLSFSKAMPKFATGGTIPHANSGYFVGGTHFSGDVTPIMANAGELVLNKAQQGNLASQLQGSGMQNLNLTATIKGEQIRLALNNNGRRTGRGEYVQSRNVR